MRDQEDGSPPCKLFECLVDQLLAFDIDLAGRLIQNQNLRIAENGASQRRRCR